MFFKLMFMLWPSLQVQKILHAFAYAYAYVSVGDQA